MPIYEFECESCCACFEKIVFGKEADEVTCPACCSKEVRKVVSPGCILGVGKGSACAPGGASKGFT